MSDKFDQFIQQLVSVAVATRRSIDPYGSPNNQGRWDIKYGYACVTLPPQLVTLLCRKDASAPIVGDGLCNDLTASGRAEGDFSAPDSPHGKRLIRFHAPVLNTEDWWPKLLAWVVDILATGRTLECGQGIGLNNLQKDFPRYSNTIDHPLRHIHTLLEPGEGELPLNMDPPYQRGHVWTDEQATAFMGYFLQTGGAHNPAIFINRRPWAAMDGSDEVIDGKQRLTAMRRWVDGDILAKAFGRLMWFKDTTECERRKLPSIRISYVELTPTQILRFYLVLNSGGTPHTQKEIEDVTTQLAFALEIP